MTHCPRCHAPLPQPPERFCPSCGADLAVPTPPPMTTSILPPPIPAGTGGGAGGGSGWGGAPPPPSEGAGTPWDRRDEVGFGSALVDTTQMIYTEPAGFFRAMRVTGGLVSPLLYGLIVGYIGLVASTIYSVVMQSIMGTGFLSQLGNEELASRLAPFFQSTIAGAVFNLVLGPVVIAVVLFIIAGVTHLVLSLLGSGERGFEATFRVTCFAYASALLNIIPVCGGLLASVWMVVLMVIGLAEAHHTTRGKAAAAVLLPIVLCCCCFGAGLAAIISMAASAAR